MAKEKSPVDILKARYAKGEITKGQYEEMGVELNGEATAKSTKRKKEIDRQVKQLGYIILFLFVMGFLAIIVAGDGGGNGGVADDGGTAATPTAGTSTVPSLAEAYAASNISQELALCSEQVVLLYNSGKYNETQELAFECRQKIIQFDNQIKEWRTQYTSPTDVKFFDRLIVSTKRHDAQMNYYYTWVDITQKREAGDLTDVQSISMYSDATTGFLETARYAYSKGIRLNSSSYKTILQYLNKLYDRVAETQYKYAAQVDPNDPLIISIVDSETSGMGNDKEAIKSTLMRYVQEKVSYHYDPDWQADWVYPPVITLATGEGDCDDFSVLLASLYRRAGIAAELCLVDTTGGETIDHMTVLVDNTVWDATGFTDVSGWTFIECFEPDLYMKNNPLRNPCTDGTHSGKCSTSNIGWQCYNGKLSELCSKCGCPSGYQCFNERCLSCPSGYYLAVDGKCHSSH